MTSDNAPTPIRLMAPFSATEAGFAISYAIKLPTPTTPGCTAPLKEANWLLPEIIGSRYSAETSPIRDATKPAPAAAAQTGTFISPTLRLVSPRIREILEIAAAIAAVSDGLI